MADKHTDDQKGITPSSGPEILTNEIRAVINQTAKRIVRRTAMSDGDLPDIEQTLITAVLAAVKAFDPQLGTWHAFARQVVRRAANNLLRERFTDKRDPRRCVSLHMTVKVDDEEVAELSQQVTYLEAVARTGGRYREPQEMSELQMDVQTFIEKLPEHLRQLALDLMTFSKSEIPHLRSTPRTTVQSRIRRLRALAEDNNLQDFLRGPSSFGR